MIILGFNLTYQILAKHWLFNFCLTAAIGGRKYDLFFLLNCYWLSPKLYNKSCSNLIWSSGLSDFNPHIYSFLGLFVIKMMRKCVLRIECISNSTTVKLSRKLKAQYSNVKCILEVIWKRLASFLEISESVREPIELRRGTYPLHRTGNYNPTD